MGLTNTQERWGWLSQSFHWLIALLIFANFGLGLYADELPRSPQKLELYLYHKSIGLSVLALVVLRLLWRLAQRTPRLPEGTPVWQRRAAHLSHFLLYVLMLVVPLVGWYLNSVANVPLRWFGLFEIPALAEPDKAAKELAEWWHWALAWSLIVVAVLHLAAALKHHFHDHDDVLRRMLPTGKKS